MLAAEKEGAAECGNASESHISRNSSSIDICTEIISSFPYLISHNMLSLAYWYINLGLDYHIEKTCVAKSLIKYNLYIRMVPILMKQANGFDKVIKYVFDKLFKLHFFASKYI